MARHQPDKGIKKSTTTTKAKRGATTRKTVAPPSIVSRVHEASDHESNTEMAIRSLGEANTLSPSPTSPTQVLDTTFDAEQGSQDLIHRRIAERAFLLYLNGGCEHGRDLEHWFNAEHDIRRNTHEPND